MSPVTIDLTGTSVLITGGSRGIGRAIVERFLEAGAQVGLVASSEASARGAAESLAAAGHEIAWWAADVSDADAANRIIDEFVERFDGIGALVNNAGITRDNLLVRLKDEDWQRVIDVNLKGAFLWCRAAARPMMKAKHGSIINVSSVVGLTGNKGQANYAASKAGLLGLTRSIALELAARKIRVNAICPGFIETEMTATLDASIRNEGARRIPLGRFGEAREVADSCLFLASDLSAYITGSTLVVDGGMTLA